MRTAGARKGGRLKGSGEHHAVPSLDSLTEQLRLVSGERDLYLGLLGLGASADVEHLMERALKLITEILGAQRGYLELSNPEGESEAEPLFLAAGCSEEELANIRENVSSGIIAHAVAQGQALSVPSALLDPRFKDRASVKRSKIEAVLCVPVGAEPPLGVLYVQGRNASGPFPAEDVERAKLFARHLLPITRQLFERQRRAELDPTEELRERFNFDMVVGRSPAIAHLLQEVALAAPLDVSVLITGPTGTGKSQIARVIHDNSGRKSDPFVELNCAALPENLMESELFGAVAGAHSTATNRISGKVAAAQGGTLFLDEIAELTPTAQAKLLQLLQTKEYYPLGSSRAERADVRILAATNVDLAVAIKERGFREDLYYRLQVLPIRVPSLAERKEDIADLAACFSAQAARRHGLSPVGLSPEARRVLFNQDWPGHVRQLAHVVEVGAIRASASGAEQMEPCHLFAGQGPQATGEESCKSFQEQTRAFQRELLHGVLLETDWNIAKAARQLDLTRAHVYNLVKSLGLARDGQRGGARG